VTVRRRATASLFFPEAGGGDGDVERKGASPFTVTSMQRGLGIGPPLGLVWWLPRWEKREGWATLGEMRGWATV
jgi:hypothetical protein